MKVLAIESSAVTASVAIMTENTLIAEYTINYKKTHSQTLLPMIDEICRMTETDVSDIDIVAVSDGPGSFTGLRIGAATGKGIALAKDKPMVAVPTLEAMAYNLMGDKRLICPVMDARRQHLYSGLYRFDAEKLEIIHEQCLISYQELVDILNAQDEEVEPGLAAPFLHPAMSASVRAEIRPSPSPQTRATPSPTSRSTARALVR